MGCRFIAISMQIAADFGIDTDNYLLVVDLSCIVDRGGKAHDLILAINVDKSVLFEVVICAHNYIRTIDTQCLRITLRAGWIDLLHRSVRIKKGMGDLAVLEIKRPYNASRVVDPNSSSGKSSGKIDRGEHRMVERRFRGAISLLRDRAFEQQEYGN